MHQNQFPPGRTRIVQALRDLMDTKEFNAITTAEIARTAGVTEGLIYKYFKDKRDLLYQVLYEHFMKFLSKIEADLKGITGALDKLEALIRSNLQSYNEYRVFTRILLLEVRNSPGFFKSEAYRCVVKYSQMINDIIEEGVKSGELRKDVKPQIMRQVIQGAIEHACLTAILFNREICPDTITENLCRTLFGGMSEHYSVPVHG